MNSGRRVRGVLVLVLGLMVALIVPRVLDPGIDGVAVRAPLPLPPPAGSCLVLPTPLSQESMQIPFELPDYSLVDCGEFHDLEVASSWVSDAPFEWENFNDDYPCSAETGLLYDSANELVPKPWWSAIVNANVMLVQAPATQRLADTGWMACIVTPFPFGKARGSVWDLPDIRFRPADFGNCATAGMQISCTDPHSTEYLAWAFGQQPDDSTVVVTNYPALPVESILRESCQTLAADLLKHDDPTFGGRVQIVLEYETIPDQEVWVEPDPDTHWQNSEMVPGTITNASCQLLVTDNHWLTDSLVGIGNQPLPIR